MNAAELEIVLQIVGTVYAIMKLISYVVTALLKPQTAEEWDALEARWGPRKVAALKLYGAVFGDAANAREATQQMVTGRRKPASVYLAQRSFPPPDDPGPTVRSPPMKPPSIPPMAMLVVMAVATCAACAAMLPSTKPTPGEAYTNALIACVNASQTIEESHACRHAVDKKLHVDGGVQ